MEREYAPAESGGPEIRGPETGLRAEPALEEVRALYVGSQYPLYARDLARFDRRSGFAFSWSWTAFIGGPFWFLYRKMYWAALFFLGIGLFNLAFFFFGLGSVYARFWPSPGGCSAVLAGEALIRAVMALTGRWLYWRSMEKMTDRAWDLFGRTPGRPLEWLARKGGVNAWVPVALAALAIAFLALAVNQPGYTQ